MTRPWSTPEVGDIIDVEDSSGTLLTVTGVYAASVVCHSSATLQQCEKSRQDLVPTAMPGRWRLVSHW